ncbi:MAG: 1-deoxy-D-xylulose-5-phosphate reductoisomerase [Opitutales bacterium]
MEADRPKRIVLLGATGSIGGSTLKVLRYHPTRFELVGISAHRNADGLAAIAHEFQVPQVALTDGNGACDSSAFPEGTTIHREAEGLVNLATLPEADLVLVAVVGTHGLRPTLAALEAGKDIALANKEVLVMAGAFVVDASRRHGGRLLPTDSEHNAIFQCLQGDHNREALLDGLVLTASGGALRDWPVERLADVRPADALKHPNWDMGPKVTLDSATMANKGLELIEAHWLFGLAENRIEVAIHPESIVHSLVRFRDGNYLAQLSPPSMTFAIQNCLLFPDRLPGPEQTIDFARSLSLRFAPPEPGRYPCLGLARSALRLGGAAPAVFNAANEVAVEAFMHGRIRFTDIPGIIDKALESTTLTQPSALDDLIAVDAEARRIARSLIA